MKSENAIKILEDYWKQNNATSETITPCELFELMFSFYSEHRFEDVDLDEDGDMLLFQYGGPYTWDPGYLILDITRQFITSEDQEMSQLSMSFKYKVSDSELKDEEWCCHPDNLEDFKKYVEKSVIWEWTRGKSVDDYSLEQNEV